MNKQLWRFTVVQNPAMLDALAAVIREEAGRDPAYHFHGANVLILASNERDNPHGVEDCACALENMFLAAHALGIGSVWINQFKGICDRPRVRGLLTRLHLPDTHIVLGCAALGYAARPRRLRSKNGTWWNGCSDRRRREKNRVGRRVSGMAIRFLNAGRRTGQETPSAPCSLAWAVYRS